MFVGFQKYEYILILVVYDNLLSEFTWEVSILVFEK